MSNLKCSEPVTLNCGLTLPNRLVKSAMAEAMTPDGMPSEALGKVYRQWSEGGWGMVLTGNIMVDSKHLGQPGDLAIDADVDDSALLPAWKAFAEAGRGSSNTPLIAQLNHPGRQSPRGAGKRSQWDYSLAPSAIPLRVAPGIIGQVISWMVFGLPRAATTAEIEAVIAQFVCTAKLCADAGFAGIEIHAAHGYLLAQFLSAKANQRTEEYGGSPAKRAKLIVDIIKAIRVVVPAGFCIGIKLNSVDHQSPTELNDCLEQLHIIADAGVDFIEISGGTYEDPKMFLEGYAREEQAKSERTKAREAFFLEFAKAIRSDFRNVPLCVTGGFRSRQGLETAIASDDCDMVGLGRPSVMNPLLPRSIVFNKELSDQDATFYTKRLQMPWFAKVLKVRAVGAGVESHYYAGLMKESAATK